MSAEPQRAPPALRSRVPDLQVERTEWHPKPERRVAVVDVPGRPGPVKLHEGDAVGPLVVVEIEPSGVVFRHEGVEFRRPVGAPR